MSAGPHDAPQRAVLDERVSVIRDALRPEAPPPTLQGLLAAWTRAAFRVCEEADGLTFLRLLVRVIDDPEAEAAVKAITEQILRKLNG